MTAAIDPGRFRERLSLEAELRSPDGCGGHQVEWQPICHVWAAIRPISAAAAERAGNRVPQTAHEIILRANDAVRASRRLVKDQRIFEIEAVFDPDESGRYMVCRAIERQ